MSEPTSTTSQPESGRKVQPQVLRDRSRASGFDLVKLLISLATGGVATYFIALTERPVPPLSSTERNTVFISILFMVAAVLIGLIGWGLDAAFFRYWAKSLESTNEETAKEHWDKRRKYNRWRLWAMRLLAVFFLLGVVGSGCYVVLRSRNSTPVERQECRSVEGTAFGGTEKTGNTGGSRQ